MYNYDIKCLDIYLPYNGFEILFVLLSSHTQAKRICLCENNIKISTPLKCFNKYRCISHQIIIDDVTRGVSFKYNDPLP